MDFMFLVLAIVTEQKVHQAPVAGASPLPGKRVIR